MIRLTGGEMRGRSLKTPPGHHTRPTQAKLRQALFNSIQFEMEDAQIADLFAGSGALGFEALSRGAKFVTFVESAAAVQKILKANAESLGVTQRCKVIGGPVPTVLSVLPTHLDLVLADPPYGQKHEVTVLESVVLADRVKTGGKLILEWMDRDLVLPDAHGCWRKAREREYGESVLTTYEKVGDTPN